MTISNLIFGSKPQKSVETPEWDDGLPNVVPSDGKNAPAIDSLNIVVPVKRRRNHMIAAAAFLLFLSGIAFSFGFGIYIYNHLNRSYSSFFPVFYHEGTSSGQFQEYIEIDTANGVYEKLHVPSVLDSRRSTIVHDFEKNLTAIIDKDRTYCFIMELNRTVVQPPQNLYDLIIKTKSGYYIPDGEVIRKQYRVLGPEIEDIGDYIYNECQYFNTYRLIRADEPYVRNRKRSVTGLRVRQVYNLGETMGKYIMFVEIIQ